MKYIVAIVEELRREVEVEAKSRTQAYEIVKEKYDKEEIVLDGSDYWDTDIIAYPREGSEVYET